MTGRMSYRWRRLWNKGRWVALAAVLPVVWACNARPLVPPNPMPRRTVDNTFQESVNKDIDILFMVDNSSSMTPLQVKLADQFPRFMEVLQGLPGGLPNVHIGVVSSDMGAGREAGIGQCTPGGDQGQFHSMVGQNGMMRAGGGGGGALVPCTTTGLNAGQSFIENVNDVANYTGDISNVFSCIAGLGDKGCGFEHQIESVVRALGADGFAPPDSNAGFLRRNAFLSIIFITNEDDCSAPSDSQLFNPDDTALGPLTNFRCNEYGHLCNGAPPARDSAQSFGMGECQSNPAGALIPIETLVNQVQSLKDTPSSILVAAIAGFPDPYATHLESPAAGEPQSGAISHSCMQTAGEYADPSPRLAEFVSAFNGVYLSICAASFAPALQQIAREIGKILGPKCVSGPFVDKDLATAGTQFDCTVVDQQFQADGTRVDTIIPSCDDQPGAAKCWELVPDATNCPGDQRVLNFVPPVPDSVSSLNAAVSCSVCIGAGDPRCAN